MPTRAPLFLDTLTGSLKGISSTIDQALVAGIRSGAATNLTLDRAGAAGTTVTIGAADVTYGSSLAALIVGSTTFALANTTATTLNFAGGASVALNMGHATGTTTIAGNTVVSGDLAVNGATSADLTTTTTTATLFNANATTVNIAGGATAAVTIGGATGTLTIGNPTITGTNATVLNLNGASPSIATTSTTASVFNATVTTLNIGAAATTIAIGNAAGNTSLSGNMSIGGNLTVVGTTFTTQSETVLINDNHLYLNNAYTTAVAQTGGLVVNRLPSATASTVAAGGFTAGVNAVSNPTVVIAASAVFAVGDLIQVSGATLSANNGLFEVLSNATATMTIRGIGLTGTVDDFTQNQFVTSAGAVGAVTKINVSVMRSNAAGTFWEVGFGSVTPVAFSDLATGASSGWTDDGAVVRLTLASDNVGIGTATPGTNKVNITNDTTGDRNLLLVEVAAQTAAPFRIETSAAVLEFQVAVGGDTTVAGDLAVNGPTSADLTTTTTTATLFNTAATTLSLGGAATTINAGAAASTFATGFNAVTSSQASVALFNTGSTATLNIGGVATTLSLGAATGTLTIGNPTITGTNATSFNMNGVSPSITTTSTATASVFNTNATTVNIGGAGTTVSIGAATGTTTINNANTVVTGDLAVNGGDLTAPAGTFNLLNTAVTTLNIGGAGTTISIGASGGITTIPGSLVVNGNITLGDANTDNITVGGEFVSSLIPDVTLTSDLGSSTKLWNNLFVGSVVSNAVGATYVAGAAGVTANKVVFKDTVTDSAVLHATNVGIATANTVVGVTRAAAAATVAVVVDYAGVTTMESAGTITRGQILYLSTGGLVTATAPTLTGEVILVVGYAKTGTAGGTFLAQLAPRTPFEIP